MLSVTLAFFRNKAYFARGQSIALHYISLHRKGTTIMMSFMVGAIMIEFVTLLKVLNYKTSKNVKNYITLFHNQTLLKQNL